MVVLNPTLHRVGFVIKIDPNHQRDHSVDEAYMVEVLTTFKRAADIRQHRLSSHYLILYSTLESV